MSKELIEEFAKKLIERVEELSFKLTPVSIQKPQIKKTLANIFFGFQKIVSSKAKTREKIEKLEHMINRFLNSENESEDKMPYSSKVRFNDSLNAIEWGNKYGYGVKMNTDKHIELLQFIREFRKPVEIVNVIKDVIYNYVDGSEMPKPKPQTKVLNIFFEGLIK
jgi:hypothetical protein